MLSATAMSIRVVIGIDVGTSGVKVVAVDRDGHHVGVGTSAFSPSTPQPGWAEELPEDWWDATSEAIRACYADSNSPIAAAAVSLSGHMSGLVLLDEYGASTRPCMLLADSRGNDEASAIDEGTRARIVQRSGNVPGSAFALAKLLWVKKREPSAFSRSQHVLLPKDYVRYRLTDAIHTEPTDAGNLLLLNSERTDWDTDLVEQLGLDVSLFPTLLQSTDISGYVSDAASRMCGIPAGTPVVAGGADMACAAVGAGALREDVAAITIGTASPVIAVVPGVHRAGVEKVTFHPHAVSGRQYAMGTVFSGGLAMRWLARAFGEMDEATSEPSAYFTRLSQEAGKSRPGSDGVLFLPFLLGSSTPFWNSRDRAAWLGLSYSSSRSDIVRAVMEGVAYNCRDSVEIFHEMGVQPQSVHLAGGGAQSVLWRQIMANVFGLPIRPVRNHNVSALGAAAMAGAGVGFFPSLEEAADVLTSYEETVEPEGHTTSVYDNLYAIYRRAREALVATNRDLSEGEWSGS